MCSWCEVTETGFCFCGTSMDPEGRTDPCQVKDGQSTSCSVCGHNAGAAPMDTSVHGSDYSEF